MTGGRLCGGRVGVGRVGVVGREESEGPLAAILASRALVWYSMALSWSP